MKHIQWLVIASMKFIISGLYDLQFLKQFMYLFNSLFFYYEISRFWYWNSQVKERSQKWLWSLNTQNSQKYSRHSLLQVLQKSPQRMSSCLQGHSSFNLLCCLIPMRKLSILRLKLQKEAPLKISQWVYSPLNKFKKQSVLQVEWYPHRLLVYCWQLCPRCRLYLELYLCLIIWVRGRLGTLAGSLQISFNEFYRIQSQSYPISLGTIVIVI